MQSPLAGRPKNAGEEQAVIATINLRGGGMGGTEERERITVLEGQLSDAIKRSATGEFDGDEYGSRVCTIYMYGPSAERLFAVTFPLLKQFRAPKGSYVMKYHGGFGSDLPHFTIRFIIGSVGREHPKVCRPDDGRLCPSGVGSFLARSPIKGDVK